MEPSQEEHKEGGGLVNQENVRTVLNLYDEPVNAKNIYPGKRERPKVNDASIPLEKEDSMRGEDEEQDEDYSPEKELNEPHSGDEEEVLDEVKDVVLVRAELVDSPVSARNILTERLRKRLAIAKSLNAQGESGDEDEDDNVEDPDYVPREEEEVLSGMDPLVQAEMEKNEKKKRGQDKSKKEAALKVVKEIERSEQVPKVVSKILSLPQNEEKEVTAKPVLFPPASMKHHAPVMPEGLAELQAEIGPLIVAQMEKMKQKKKMKRASFGRMSAGGGEDEEDSFVHKQREILRTKSIHESGLADAKLETHVRERSEADISEEGGLLKEPPYEDKAEIAGELSNTERDAAQGICEEEITDDEEEELPHIPQYREPFWCFCSIL